MWSLGQASLSVRGTTTSLANEEERSAFWDVIINDVGGGQSQRRSYGYRCMPVEREEKILSVKNSHEGRMGGQ